MAAWRARVAAWRASGPAPRPAPPEYPGSSAAARLYRLAMPPDETSWGRARGLSSPLARVLPTVGHPVYRGLGWRPPVGARLAVPLWSGPAGQREVVALALWSGEPGEPWLAPSGLLAATPAARLAGRGAAVQDLHAYIVCSPSEPVVCRT